MKKKNQKISHSSKGNSKAKNASYIGALVAVVIASLGLILTARMPDDTLSSIQNLSTPVPLPTMPATSSFAPASFPERVLPSPSPTVVPEPEEASISVAAKPETLQIVLPIEGKTIVPFTGEQLTYSKTLEDWRAHTGIDIAAPFEAEVRAAADGTVEQAYLDPQMGYTIAIHHGELYQTLYQNLTNADVVSVGQAVKAGDLIGTVGHSASSELAEESHLHFAVLAGHIFQNPIDFLIIP